MDHRGIISNVISLPIAKQVIQFQNPVLRVCFLVPAVTDQVSQKANPEMEITCASNLLRKYSQGLPGKESGEQDSEVQKTNPLRKPK